MDNPVPNRLVSFMIDDFRGDVFVRGKCRSVILPTVAGTQRNLN